MNKISTIFGSIQQTTLDNFFKNVVCIDIITQTVHQTVNTSEVLQFNKLKEEIDLKSRAFFLILSKLKLYDYYDDFTYTRSAVVVVDITTDNLEKQLIYPIVATNVKPLKGKNFDVLVEDAAVQVAEQYGMPSHVIKLSDTRYVVVDAGAETMSLKKVSKDKGALIVYAPGRCCMIELI